MQSTGIDSLDMTIQKTNTWLKEIMEEIGTSNRHLAYIALRSVLQALRDRLTVEEATDFGAQLPTLIRGLYYEAWDPTDKPVKFNKEEFLSYVQAQLPDEPRIDADEVARKVFRVIEKYIADGQIEDIKSILPADLKSFWEGI